MDPFTIAAAISAAGALFKGVTGFLGGNAEDQAEKQAAQQHLNEAGVNADEALMQGDQAAARAATQVAANGGGFGGSSLGVINQLSSDAMFNARAQAYRGRTQAQSDLYAGSVAKTQGVDSLISGVVGAGSSIAGGFMRQAQFGAQMNALGRLRGYGADSPYDYMPTQF